MSTPQMQYQCLYCDKTAQDLRGLVAHTRSVHQDRYVKWQKLPRDDKFRAVGGSPNGAVKETFTTIDVVRMQLKDRLSAINTELQRYAELQAEQRQIEQALAALPEGVSDLVDVAVASA